jgi:uncharacterized protein (TIGR03083 family)
MTGGAMPSDEELVDQLEEVWTSIGELGDSLSAEEWALPTECPGWSLQDNVAHIIGIESMILGRPTPERELGDLPHLKNDIGRGNELWVDAYRELSGPQVLEEFRAVTGERLGQLRSLDDAGFSAETWTPAGPGQVRDQIPFRTFDSWVHEQDMRRAVGRPGHLDGPAAQAAFDRIAGLMGYVVGKKVKPPDGTTVMFTLDGPLARPLALGVEGGRAFELETPPPDPTVTLTMSDETLHRLGCGRIDPIAADVVIAGDDALGRRIVGEMNVLF